MMLGGTEREASFSVHATTETSARASETSALRSTRPLVRLARPVRENASRSSMSVAMRPAASVIVFR